MIQTEKYVVAVEVEMVIPVDDPSKPCYESERVNSFANSRSMPSREMWRG